jgi:hypothetical protein
MSQKGFGLSYENRLIKLSDEKVILVFFKGNKFYFFKGNKLIEKRVCESPYLIYGRYAR